MTFDAVVTPRSRDGLSFHFDTPTGWEQGRGLFGGLVIGAMTRCLEAAAPTRRVRSLTAEIFAPVPAGPGRVQVEVLREGNAVTTATAKWFNGTELCAHVVAVLGQARALQPAPQLASGLTPPTPPDWKTLDISPVEPPMAPTFTQHLETRIVSGVPFTDPNLTRTEAFVRFKDLGGPRDLAWLIGLADTLYPVSLAAQELPRPMSTLAFTLQPFSLDGLDPDAPLFHRATQLNAEDGYVVEQRELWSPGGRLLALNQQTFVVIK